MKRKILTFILTICCLLPCALVLSACGHTHTYDKSAWVTTDAEGHYHLCSDCGKMVESKKIAHTYTSDCDTTCNVCGYERTTIVNHEFDAYVKIDDSNQHFHTCIQCGINETGDCDNDCFNNCSYCNRVKKNHSYVEGVCACGDVEGLQYEYNTQGGYKVSGYTGTLTSFTIPERYNDGTHGTCSVNEIGSIVISSNNTIRSITIPKTVTSISEGAFNNCTNLEQLVVQSGNAKYHSQSNCIIETETNTLVVGCKNSTIPDGITKIGKDAFYCCSGLISITLPSTVTTIGDRAFWECTNLEIITFSNVTNIGYSVFRGCTSLTSITLPETLNTIGDYAFYDCSGLTSIIIPNSVNSLGAGIFDGCSNLEYAILGSGIKEIKMFTFNRCEKLKYIVIGNLNSSSISVQISAFQKCKGLENVYTTWSNESDIDNFKKNINQSNNSKLINATYYLYKQDAPTTNGTYKYWHYDATGNIEVWPSV